MTNTDRYEHGQAAGIEWAESKATGAQLRKLGTLAKLERRWITAAQMAAILPDTEVYRDWNCFWDDVLADAGSEDMDDVDFQRGFRDAVRGAFGKN